MSVKNPQGSREDTLKKARGGVTMEEETTEETPTEEKEEGAE